MSLRHAFRSKFRIDREREPKDVERESQSLLRGQSSFDSFDDCDENGPRLINFNSDEVNTYF